MKIVLNKKTVTIPSSLSEITLGQRIDFHNQYGRELDRMLESIVKMEEGIDKELELINYQLEKMFRTFAFFAGATVEAVKDEKFVDDIASIYYASLAPLLEDESKLELQHEFAFKGEMWEIASPKISQSSKMTFGEFVDAKQITKDLHDLGMGRWETMLRLCAIFFRKKGEEYKPEFVYEESERLALMRELPMDIAMHVGFFLTSSLNFCLNTLQSSGNPEQSRAESMNAVTSTSGAG